MDREGLADFLRRRRAALQPVDVGLPHGTRRRTAGLRREVVSADDVTQVLVVFGGENAAETV